ncbi:endonuclease/exonuclease/phosphatase family protein [Gymnodinialimonas sp. 2305UL16-5]|uniref:endonuclease/exonuclease/phosphatase family protein n=1 Tax=Gymnodinialimonas mytili TaxID=3126503 RepID=UPI0030AFACE0
MLQDIIRGDESAPASLDIILNANADILALQDFDYDGGGSAVTALRTALFDRGLDYPHFVSLRPNTGRPTGFDLDGDGRNDLARDAHGYGRFSGAGGMVLLSRYPIGAIRDFSELLWRDLPESRAAEVTAPDALEVLRLHTVGAWDVEVMAPAGPIHILMSHATPPVFDGPEDRNGLRNADELRFWSLYLDGWTPEGTSFVAAHFAVLGTFNVDPDRGEGLRRGIDALLRHPALQDPRPTGAGGLATADWEDPVPGDLRVDYILPATVLNVVDSGVLWPEDGARAETAAEASDHRLVWVDVQF